MHCAAFDKERTYGKKKPNVESAYPPFLDKEIFKYKFWDDIQFPIKIPRSRKKVLVEEV